MVYFCLQVSFNFVCKPFRNISTFADSKNFENVFLDKGNLYSKFRRWLNRQQEAPKGLKIILFLALSKKIVCRIIQICCFKKKNTCVEKNIS